MAFPAPAGQSRTTARPRGRSEHPLGRAVVRDCPAGTGDTIAEPDAFEMLPGRGVRARVDGHGVAAGNRALLEELGVPFSAAAESARPYESEGCSVIHVAVDGQWAGLLALSDTLRPEAADTVARVKACGVSPVLLTGDHQNAANCIAGQLGIDLVRAGCLPEDKLNWIDESQKAGSQVCMIGDGINDAPALKKAHVGIAMGGVGSDIAVDAADIALVSDDIGELPHLLRLSKRMMRTIKCNLTFSMALNFAAILLAISGVLNPVVGALVHNAGSVVVIIHSALLLKWRSGTVSAAVSPIPEEIPPAA